jgi:anti-sigma factor RsiW|nr:zf-HC2 domain-containing protein [Mycolicibacterium austroafricanum]
MILTCRWSARRLQRYLDADPAAPLDAHEIHRLETHLAACDKCRAAVAEHRMIDSALARWAARTLPDRRSIERVHNIVDRLIEGELH